jgi:transposase
MLPREYPLWQTVYYHFRKWRIDGRLRRAHDRLRDAVRQAEGRERDPSAAVVDGQVVKTTPVGGPEWRKPTGSHLVALVRARARFVNGELVEGSENN